MVRRTFSAQSQKGNSRVGQLAAKGRPVPLQAWEAVGLAAAAPPAELALPLGSSVRSEFIT
ncbi:hypothetical protein STRDD11_00016 [Streptococcus sp. DD11]|nr:hypothetical protein STRDD11_00016 [Streptococcus sp. DD11]